MSIEKFNFQFNNPVFSFTSWSLPVTQGWNSPFGLFTLSNNFLCNSFNFSFFKPSTNFWFQNNYSFKNDYVGDTFTKSYDFDYKFEPVLNNNTLSNWSDFNFDYKVKSTLSSDKYTTRYISSTPAKPKTYSLKVSSSEVDNSYLKYKTKSAAESAAKNDPRLEKLTGGKGWSVADTFRTDIPYARKGTSEILELVSEKIGRDLVITSALATGVKGSPHQVGGYASHHNAENPKIDIDANGDADKLAAELRATGLFSHVLAEGTHVDVQISPEAYAEYA